MSLPGLPLFNEAVLRTLEPKCSNPKSPTSKRIVVQLRTQPQMYKTIVLTLCTTLGLGNLVRCAMEAHVSPDTTTTESLGSLPMLCFAALRGNTPVLKALLRGGANVELTNQSGVAALTAAAQVGHLSCLQLVLDAGAKPNAQDNGGHTALMTAVSFKQVECVRALLPVSDLSLLNKEGLSAFHVSVLAVSEECFELLLPVSDVNSRTGRRVDATTGQPKPPHGFTALHMACQGGGHASMCKALLSRGADRMALDSEQRIPLHWAVQGGSLACVIQLVGRPGRARMTPAELDTAEVSGLTALHTATLAGFDQICAVLVGAGASLHVETDGITPLMFAQAEKPVNTALVALLSGKGQPHCFGLACDHCGTTAEEAAHGLKVCRGCQEARYCCKECQLTAWPEHTAACEAKVKEREEKFNPRRQRSDK